MTATYAGFFAASSFPICLTDTLVSLMPDGNGGGLLNTTRPLAIDGIQICQNEPAPVQAWRAVFLQNFLPRENKLDSAQGSHAQNCQNEPVPASDNPLPEGEVGRLADPEGSPQSRRDFPSRKISPVLQSRVRATTHFCQNEPAPAPNHPLPAGGGELARQLGGVSAPPQLRASRRSGVYSPRNRRRP